MSIYTTDQSLSWRLIEVPFYDSDFKLNVRSGRKERFDPFWESPRMVYSPLVVGITDRNPVLAAATSPLINVPTLPVYTENPVLTGLNLIGSLMSVTDGVVIGTAPITFTYDWKRDAVSIGAPDLNTYTTVPADDGTEITCEVTATNGLGSDMATSNGIDVGTVPVFTVSPFLLVAEIVVEYEEVAQTQPSVFEYEEVEQTPPLMFEYEEVAQT